MIMPTDTKSAADTLIPKRIMYPPACSYEWRHHITMSDTILNEAEMSASMSVVQDS